VESRRCTGLRRPTPITRLAQRRSSRLRRIRRRPHNMRLRKDKAARTAMAVRIAVRVRTLGPTGQRHGRLPVIPIMLRRGTRALRRTRRGGQVLAFTVAATVAPTRRARTPAPAGVTGRVRPTRAATTRRRVTRVDRAAVVVPTAAAVEVRTAEAAAGIGDI
jgi:hypothetical protein